MRQTARILFLLGFLSLASAQAGVILVSEPDLGANGSTDLTALGPEWTAFPSALLTVNGIPGLTVRITDVGNDLQRVTQGTTWKGNFAPGEPLLWTHDQNGPMMLSFSSPVKGAGMQIQATFYGGFWAGLEGFDSLGNSLGTVYRTDGFSSNAGNDSAIFMGIKSDSADINSVRVFLYQSSGYTTSFAINGPVVLGAPQDASVPEPASALLFGAGGLMMLAFARRRRSA